MSEQDSETLGLQPVEEEATAEQTGVPDWVVIPPDFKMPPGRVISFLRFRADWTDTPAKGDRQCIVWNLTDADERIALKRGATQDAVSMVNELAKQCVRAVDGVKVNWGLARGPGSIDEFWREIGAKCRQLVVRWYTQNHALSDEEQKDFFENCVAVRTMG